jgi:hypothetical protein
MTRKEKREEYLRTILSVISQLGPSPATREFEFGMDQDHGVGPQSTGQWLKRFEKEGIIKSKKRGATLFWSTVKSSNTSSGDSFGPKKQSIRDKKLDALKEYGPKEVKLMVSLPGLPLRDLNNHESCVFALHPKAVGYGAEADSKRWKKIKTCPNKPARYQVIPGELRTAVLDDLEEPIQYGDADFCGGLKPEVLDTLIAFFEKMDDGGLLCITLNEFFRSSGGNEGTFDHIEGNNELNMLIELKTLAEAAERHVRMVLYEPYISNKTPMVTVGLIVTGEPTFYE